MSERPARPGPGSVTWDVNGERLVIAGWSRAILLQIAHPLIAAGVARHSGFRDGGGASVARLAQTVRAMLSLTFGTEAEADAVVARIRAIHDRVHGALGEETPAFPAGQAYSAHDAGLLAWVHVTLVDSNLRAYDLLVKPLSGEAQDRYCAEARGGAAALGVPIDLLPATIDGLRGQIDARLASGEIQVTREARELACAILWPASTRAPWLWPLGVLNRFLTIGLLPPPARLAFGLSWTARQARWLPRFARAVRLARRIFPAAVARWRASRNASAVRAHEETARSPRGRARARG